MATNSHADVGDEQPILEAWKDWAQKEHPERRRRADQAYKRALQIGDEPSWQHAEIVERSYAQLTEMMDTHDPYFARLRGTMQDVDGETFEVDLRVHRYHRSETFPLDPMGQEMLDISHLAPLADLVRNPSQKELALTLSDRDFLDWPERTNVGKIRVVDCQVEDIELEENRVVRVAPRYGAIFEDRVRRRLHQSASPALDVLADVLDQEQNIIINNRDPKIRLVILDGPAGTGKTVVATHRIAVVEPPTSPGIYLTPTGTLRDYIKPVLPRLGLERSRARALSLADLAVQSWPDFPWSDELNDIVPESTATAQEWTSLWDSLRTNQPQRSFLLLYRDSAKKLGRVIPERLEVADVAPLLWLAAWAKRPLPQPVPQWVIIDEAQSFPELALQALGQWLKGAAWILAGDFMQQGSDQRLADWGHVAETLGMPKRASAHLWLKYSYRVPPRIHALAERLRVAIQPAALPSESVRWHVQQGSVEIHLGNAGESLQQYVAQSLTHWSHDNITSVVLLAPTVERVRVWDQTMRQAGFNPQVLDGHTAYQGALAIATLDAVRGLEFDGVIILDINATYYPDTASSAKTLYTSITRSRRAVQLLADSEGSVSPWIDVLKEKA